MSSPLPDEPRVWILILFDPKILERLFLSPGINVVKLFFPIITEALPAVVFLRVLQFPLN
jgi:hypothetical protein